MLAACCADAQAVQDDKQQAKKQQAEKKQGAKYVRTTVVYKRVDDLEIKADVYCPYDQQKRAVVVWIHGGALINGHRASVPRQLRTFAEQRGYALVSIDYRLAPETKLPEIIADVEDAFAWIRGPGVKQFRFDPQRIAVCGGSAGGYLTLVTGYRVNPRPQALVAFWGYGDLVGKWYSEPSPHPRHNRRKVTKEEALKQVNSTPVSDSRQRKGNGGLYYLYCRQNGVWPQMVSDWDPKTEAQKYDPYMPVKNVNKEYPPTVLIHGTKDTDVPHEQSTMMAKQFAEHNVEYAFHSIKNGEHGLGGADAEEVKAAYDAMFAFLQKHLD